MFTALLLIRPWLKYLALALVVLATVFFWNRWLDARDAEAFARGDKAGAARVQAMWDAERTRQLADQAKREREARATETALRAQIDTNRRKSDAKLHAMAVERDRALDELRNRPERPTAIAGGAVPASPGADRPPEPGCTGAGLYRPDAAFLVREAASAAELREHLRACYAHADAIEAQMGGGGGKPD